MIQFGIVGCGRIAQKHAALCNEFGRLVAVCDIDAEKALTLGEKYRTNVYSSIGDLLSAEKSLTALVVCTPNGLHMEHAMLGLSAGLHVICEKPMAIRVEDAQKMIVASKKAKRELFIIKQNRFNKAVLAARSLLLKQSLGKITSLQLNGFWNRGADYYKESWHGDAHLDGGILFTQFSHFVDLLYWLAGDVSEVHAVAGNFHPEYEKDFDDCIVTCFTMSNGALGTGHFTINSYKKNMEGSLTLLGEKGSLKIGGKYLNEISYQLIEGESLYDISVEENENKYGTYTGSMSNHDKMYEHIAQVVTGKTQNQFPGEDGLKTVEIINKIYEAIR